MTISVNASQLYGEYPLEPAANLANTYSL